MSGLIKYKALDWGTAAGQINAAINYIYNLSFNGSDTTKNVDVSADVTDARNCIVQLLDTTHERIFCSIIATSISNIQINTGVPLPNGTYRLIVSNNIS